MHVHWLQVENSKRVQGICAHEMVHVIHRNFSDDMHSLSLSLQDSETCAFYLPSSRHIEDERKALMNEFMQILTNWKF